MRRMKNWIRKNSVFRTGRGAVVNVVEHDSRRVYFKSANGKMVNTIELIKLKAAIQDLFSRRTVTRKELEVYSNFSSALFGLLMSIFKGMAKLTSGAKGFRLTVIGVRFFFSGCDRAVKDLEIAKANGAEYVLMSYYYLRDDHKANWRKHVGRLGLKVMLDSGAYSVWKRREAGKDVQEIDVRDYAEFVLQHKDLIHSFITLDVVGDDVATAANDAYLRSLGLYPIPVFPAMGDLQELGKLVEADHDFIAIGATVGISETAKRTLFELIFAAFPEGRFHWLGGSSSLIVEFSWFSADSSTWLSGRKYGKLLNEQFKTTKAPKWMDGFAALAHNVRILSGLEYRYIDEMEAREEQSITAIAS
ncbi:hypothetical protein [Paenibacillus amylolyticus]|uniref:Uncharacterized protein n=1 Tax=Paenibacillus amylolyticus TaxID=1451 RepID=A0ABD8B2P0_PAEAM